METLATIPEWFGAAVIAALFGTIGFFGRNLFDAIKERRTRKATAIRKLHELDGLLDESLSAFRNQNYLARRLLSLLRTQHKDQIEPGLGYDETFFRMHDCLNDEERELFALIRGMTVNSMHRINGKLCEWMDENTVRQLMGESSPKIEQLDLQLGLLKEHLNAWFDKYESVFKTSERRSLVYLADEKQHGPGFPKELEPALDAVLAQLEPHS